MRTPYRIIWPDIVLDKALIMEARGQACEAWIEGMREGRPMSVARWVGDFSEICKGAA